MAHLATKWMREGSWRTAVAGGAIAFPIAVLLHELGHFAGYSVFGFPGSGPAFRLYRLGRRAVRCAHRGGGRGGCSGNCSTVAGGGRRGCGAYCLLPCSHRLRACGPPIWPRPPLSGSRSRVGEPPVTAIPRGQRVRAIVPTLVGALAVGGPLWVLWLGPLVLS